MQLFWIVRLKLAFLEIERARERGKAQKDRRRSVKISYYYEKIQVLLCLSIYYSRTKQPEVEKGRRKLSALQLSQNWDCSDGEMGCTS